MATVINAQTSAGGLSITPDLSGQIALQSNGTTVATVTPTGIQSNVGAPAFSAYMSTNPVCSHNTSTKMPFNTKEFDTNTNFDATTNYRFTPNVAGYYQVSGGITPQGDCYAWVAVYKNGSLWKYIFDSYNASASGTNVRKAFGSCMVFLNGTTDYIELYATIGSSENVIVQVWAGHQISHSEL